MRIVGMIITSPAVFDGLASCVHLVSFFFINLKYSVFFFEHAVVFSSLYQSVVKYDSVFIKWKICRKRAIVCVCISFLKSFILNRKESIRVRKINDLFKRNCARMVGSSG